MTEDEMIAASAEQAVAIGQKAVLDQSERAADSAGLTATQISDGDMNNGRNFTGGGYGGPSDVQAREFDANRHAIEARQKILAEGEMSLYDLSSPDLNSNDAIARDNARTILRSEQAAGRIANHMVEQGAQRVVQNAYMNPNEMSNLMESDAYTPMQQNDGWHVTKVSARLRNGNQIPVFIVEDTLSGMNTGKKYRIAAIAEKVSNVLNATQNMDDPRIKMINQSYDQHVQLMRSLKEAKRVGNSQKVSIIESKLQVVNDKLGLS